MLKKVINILYDIRTVIWFLLKGPSFYPSLLDYSLRNFRKNFDTDELREASMKWCQSKAISKEDLYNQLGFDSFYSEIFKDEFIEEKSSVIRSSNANFGGMGDIYLIHDICENIQAKHCIETGVAYGWSSEAILSSITKRAGKLISVDMPMIGQEDYHLIGFVVSEKYRSKWKLLRMPDMNGLLKAINMFGEKNIDFIHYDSDKSYYGRKWSQPLILNALKKDGIFVSDDINDNFAFKEFVEENTLDYFIIEYGGKYVGIIKKL